MKIILSGTDRVGSNTRKISELIKKLYLKKGEETQLLDLAELQPITTMEKSRYGESEFPEQIGSALADINNADGIVLVCPEYNGSMPGVLKWFIDHFKYPDAFEFRPVCFVGLGGLFGGLRPVEHLQQVFGYRNAFIYPERVFLINVYKNMEGPELKDKVALDLLEKQVTGFQRFCRALQNEKLDANSVRKV